MKEYSCGIKYNKEEIENISKWGELHKEYDINEYEDYIEISEKNISDIIPYKILQLKENLSKSDYKAIKYSEGYLSEEAYAPIKAQRQAWRDEINRLESLLI